MYEPPSRYNVTVTVSRDQDGQLPDPAAFAVAADEAAWRRSASIVSAHMDDRIISIVTVHAPGPYAAEAVAREYCWDGLNGVLLLVLSSRMSCPRTPSLPST
jgi:hypothetical protein